MRKQKYLESGDRYFDKGKYREAAIQYANAVQVDSRFAQAHSQLGQTYLKLGDSSRAFQELSRTVELAPDNYRAHIDLANLLVTARNPDGSPNADYVKQARIHLDLLRYAPGGKADVDLDVLANLQNYSLLNVVLKPWRGNL